MKITSNNSILIKCAGINAAAAQWVDEPVEGGFVEVPAPENWRELIAEADENTHDCYPGMTAPGNESDWQWYRDDRTNSDGYYTGIVWLAAKYIG